MKKKTVKKNETQEKLHTVSRIVDMIIETMKLNNINSSDCLSACLSLMLSHFAEEEYSVAKVNTIFSHIVMQYEEAEKNNGKSSKH